MKRCELCSNPARIYCESDQASLCWSCDEKVHGANFLVAKHTRCLLCHACQCLTPWKASGLKLNPTVSICETCTDNWNGKTEENEESQGGNDEIEDENDDFDDEEGEEGEDDDDDDLGDEDEDGDGDIQVVPWASTSKTPPPVVSSSSEEEEGEASSRFSGRKRNRENSDLDSGVRRSSREKDRERLID
ncbi:B-box-type zinc finger [Dillenia turbinata]|uniref:B-box-type zinc finger n=1 Tax=Dillenia turbinata TaxID=194707 RepID=A0AAN8VVQ7_9MAGN